MRAARTSHTYNPPQRRIFRATLTVTDANGLAATAQFEIDAGNTPPTPAITSPSATALFSVGQTITLTGTATDADDGTLPSSALSWNVRLHHDQHEHPYFSGVGNNLQFQAPQPEDLLAATNSYLVIDLTATDSKGLKRTTTRNLQPRKVNVTFASNPSGLTLYVEGQPFRTPATVVSWAGNVLDVDAPDQIGPSGEPLTWSSWSDGGGRAHNVTVPSANATITATYATVAGPAFAPSADARVRESSPTVNEGSLSVLTARGGTNADFQSFLRFRVTGVSGPVTSAKLYLYAHDGTVDGPRVYRTSNEWSESRITWGNKPGPIGGNLADLRAVPANTWAILDVTAAVTGNGTFNFVLGTGSTDTFSASSREARSRQPRLVVLSGGSATDAQAPSVPTGLTAEATTSDSVALRWNPATDDTAVSGYDVFRDGVLLGAVSGTSYVDRNVVPDQAYGYQIRARDAAGNVSGLCAMVSATTPQPTTRFVFEPDEDAYVDQAQPTANFYNATELRVRGGGATDIVSYLRFEVLELPGRPYSAKLRLYVPGGVGNGTVDGPAVYLADERWDESVITWAGRPGRSATIADDAGPIQREHGSSTT